MEEKQESLSIHSKDAPKRTVEADEKRQYYLFREIDPNYPLELIVTEVPPGHTQPWHAHRTIDEITVVLSGEVVGLTKKSKDETPQQKTIKELSFYDTEKHDFHRITATKDGKVTVILEDKRSGDIIERDLPYEEGFDAGSDFHTIENRTESWVVMATVKKTTPEMFSSNREIFQKDKIPLEA